MKEIAFYQLTFGRKYLKGCFIICLKSSSEIRRDCRIFIILLKNMKFLQLFGEKTKISRIN